MMKLIKTNEGEYRIEGLTKLHILRIYNALEYTKKKSDFILELDVIINILKMDMKRLDI